MANSLKKEKFIYRRQGAVGFFVCPELDNVVTHGFGTRYSSMGMNRPIEEIQRQKQEFCEALHLDSRTLFSMKQIHSDQVLVINEANIKTINPEADAVLTDSPNLSLAILTADCLPILIYEKEKRIVGAIHAGWKGTSMGILSKALTILETQLGGLAKDCMVLFGPSLRPCCFEIQKDVVKIFQERLLFRPEIIKRVDDKWLFDLLLANYFQAIEKGIPEKNIWALELCTFCQPGWFYSYRRDKEQLGRMISIISLNQ